MADTTPSQDLVDAITSSRDAYFGHRGHLQRTAESERLFAEAFLLGADFALDAPQPNAALADGWMPIETAPKFNQHGIPMRLILGYAPDEIHEDGFVSQGYWTEAEEDYPDSMGHDGGWADENFQFFNCPRSFGAEKYLRAGTQPTHWRPLPAPPTLNASKEAGNG